MYTTADLTSWINSARAWAAGEAEAIRQLAVVQTTVNQRQYPFSTLTSSISSPGISGVINVRRISYQIGSAGLQRLQNRPWEWFDLYHLNNPVPPTGAPRTWAQYAQGSSGQGTITGVGSAILPSGSFFIDPIPDTGYFLNCDCVCYPTALAADTDPEALPYFFTEAVPFLAAYYALMSAQTNARMADAERYFNSYKMFVERARRVSNPSVNRSDYQQSDDPTRMAKLGLTPKAQGAEG